MNASKAKVVEKKYLLTFIIITTLFALWGFANDITNPLVAAFRTIMEISNSKAALIQFAFYGGYATMAIPAALFVQKYSYKQAILLGLALYAIGALLFWPAAQFEAFGFFLLSLYILTFGLAFLETTANPYILSLGDKKTATRRLNLAQSFNPLGSILGMTVASEVILSSLQSEKNNVDFSALDSATKAIQRTHDLMVIRNPYVILGLVVILMFIVIMVTKMPKIGHQNEIHPMKSFQRLIKNKVYREGVFAQIFYVGVQIMCWTFIIHYAENLGIDKATAQRYNMIAMGIFIASRFMSTMLMKYISSQRLLFLFGVGGMLSISGVIFIGGMAGLWCLIVTSGFMSLMFPTIYGIALEQVKEDSTLGAAGLVMAIVGGALMPPLQGLIIDFGKVAWLPAVNASFILPFISFLVISVYGYRVLKVHGI
ncbi:L-fucose:H+ symporter permease [Carboxylicivirga caseinilyticus]|uniref:L-fucose:H+ symporter permease n=1 Tax=Carboxylicivirga caseinilyticus TaxID=3417572 RepID=UPI003D3394CA|nr:L-fucose:H+ symporter permease [Marinilabiliaceae bacterium A049]